MLRNLLILLTLLWLPGSAFAQDLPRPLSYAVSDYNAILPEEDEVWLTQILREARAETGVHVVLVTMNRRENHGGQGRSIEDYTKALFNSWGVGDAARNDGIMILISADDREMRVQLGSGYGSEWDGAAFGVVQEYFLPLMRDGLMVEGITHGTEAVIEQIAQPFSAGETAPSGLSSPAQERTEDDAGMMDFIFFCGMVVVALFLSLRRMVGDYMVRLRPCPQCGFSGGMRRIRQTVEPAGENSDGHGIIVTACNKCSYRDERSYTIAAKGKDRDSDDGFGGGRSSGGGATGRW